MKCLLVGADAIGCKENYLEKKFGVNEVLHWDGRNRKMPSMPLVNMVIVLTSFISHEMMQHVKKESKKRGLKILYLKRGIAELEMIA